MNEKHKAKITAGVITFLGLALVTLLVSPRNGEVFEQELVLPIVEAAFAWDPDSRRPVVRFRGIVVDKPERCGRIIRDSVLVSEPVGVPAQQIHEIANILQENAEVVWDMDLPKDFARPGAYIYQVGFWCDVKLVGRSMRRVELTPANYEKILRDMQVGGPP